MSRVQSGKMYKLGQGKVNRVWKEYHVCLRDDTSFRWYRDETFLDRRGELWLDEVASTLRFGKDVITEYGPVPRAGKGSIIATENLIAFVFADPAKRFQRKTYYFAALSNEDLVSWASRFAESLEANAVFPPQSSPVRDALPPPAAAYERLAGSPPEMRKKRSSWMKAWHLADTDA